MTPRGLSTDPLLLVHVVIECPQRCGEDQSFQRMKKKNEAKNSDYTLTN